MPSYTIIHLFWFVTCLTPANECLLNTRLQSNCHCVSRPQDTSKKVYNNNNINQNISQRKLGTCGVSQSSPQTIHVGTIGPKCFTCSMVKAVVCIPSALSCLGGGGAPNSFLNSSVSNWRPCPLLLAAAHSMLSLVFELAWECRHLG